LLLNVLFVCVGNQGRSVMAERLFRREVGDAHVARSAGAEPGNAVHPEVAAALAEVGVDAGDHVPTKLDAALLEWADVVVATCSGVCPATPPDKQRFDWSIRDPWGRDADEVRAIRDEIQERVRQLSGALDRSG
jgi:arsenate reductase (thioredoxin)